jgi:hypothetical protein
MAYGMLFEVLSLMMILILLATICSARAPMPVTSAMNTGGFQLSGFLGPLCPCLTL